MANVLIIDDDDLMRSMLVQMIEREGLSAIGAENGEKGIELLDKNEFDLIVTDIVMPEKEGLETILYLKKNCPNIPIIAISGGAKIEPKLYLNVAQDFGVNYTFAKPINKKTFLTAVRDCLDNSASPK